MEDPGSKDDTHWDSPWSCWACRSCFTLRTQRLRLKMTSTIDDIDFFKSILDMSGMTKHVQVQNYVCYLHAVLVFHLFHRFLQCQGGPFITYTE